MSAPRTRSAARERPLEMPPAKMTGPSKNLRTSDTKEKGFNQPVLPPAPAVSRIKPSTPASAARRACLTLAADRKSVVSGQSVSVRVDLGVSRTIKKKKQNNTLSK